MICSEAELGLSDNHDGIIVLPEMQYGPPLLNVTMLKVIGYSVDITPSRINSPHYGIAGDLAAWRKQRENRSTNKTFR